MLVLYDSFIVISLAPTSLTDIYNFHGDWLPSSFYCRFISGLIAVMTPITGLMKNPSFVWTMEASVAFDTIKQLLTSALVLAFWISSYFFRLCEIEWLFH